LAALGTTSLAAFAVWQLSVTAPLLPDAANGLILFGIGIAAGLRLGYESARTFIEDAVRMNKVIVEMNTALTELNGWLMTLVVRQEARSGDSSRTVPERKGTDSESNS
jgi:hypothetical protein